MEFNPNWEKPWRLVFGGVDLVGTSMQNDGKVMRQIKEDNLQFFNSSGYFDNAPFLWIGMTIRYGLKNDRTTDFDGRISKKYGDISLAKELDMRVLTTADEHDVSMLKDFFEIAALDAMIDAGKKYKLNTEALEERRAQLGQIPDWEYEMDEHPEILLKKYRDSIGIPPKDSFKFLFCTLDRSSSKLGKFLKNDILLIYESLQKNYFNELIETSGYLKKNAKFKLISLVINYELSSEAKTYFRGNNQRYRDLTLARIVDTRIFLIAEHYGASMLTDFLKITALDALIDAGEKYKLDSSALEILKKERSKLGQIPDWEYEMGEHPEILLQKYRDSVPE